MQHDVQPLSLASLHALSATVSPQLEAKHQRINSQMAAVIGMCSKLSTASQGLAVVSFQRLFGMCKLCFTQAEQVVGLMTWVTILYLNVWVCAIATVALFFTTASWVALGVLTFQLALILMPLTDTPPAWARCFLRYSICSALRYSRVKFMVDDPEGTSVKRSYIVAFEPHSALPLAMAGVFTKYSGLLPPSLVDIKVLASSALFLVPGLRHMWHWLGMRPVSRGVISSILDAGGSVALCPGGVQECLHMRHGEEALYLSRRTGFIKMAMQHNAAVVPAFAFGQTDMYSWIKPEPPYVPERAVAALARCIGFLPLVMYGAWGTPMPRPVPLTVVMGAPLVVPHIKQPSPEQVQEQLQLFIQSMESMVARHKAAAGYPDLPVKIY